MPAASIPSSTLFSALRHSLQRYLPRLLSTTPDTINQPLLNSDEILELRHRIQSRAQKPAATHFETTQQRMGDSRSTHRGYGLDYEESRPYQPGDDPRYMNWPLTARSGELYMKVFREERRPGVFVLIDRRSNMRFGTRTRLKVTQAARAATCITFAALQRHASVGGAILSTATQTTQWIKDTGNEHDAFALIHAACAACPPRNYSDGTATTEPGFSQVLNILQALITPGTQVYLISDFSDMDEQHRGQLLHLATENPVHAIHISDPAEHHLPKLGSAHFSSVDDRSSIVLDTQSADVQAEYEDAARKHFATTQQLFRGLGIPYTPLSTVDDAIENRLTES